MRKKKWSVLVAVVLLAGMMAAMLPATVQAKETWVSYSAKTSGSGNKIQVRNVSYESADQYGVSEIDVKFGQRVSWKRSADVRSIKDNTGKSYEGYLHDRDSDDCEVAIEDLKTGRTYTIVIDGIKKRGTNGYRKLTLKVKIPAAKKNAKVQVSKVVLDDDHDDDYDFDYGYQAKIDIKFVSKVSWKRSAKVTSVKDQSGKSYKGYLIEKDDDECEVYIKDMKYGKTYTIKISGVKARGASSYETISVKAKVPKRTNALQVKEVEYEEDYDDDDYDYDDYDDDDDYDMRETYKVEIKFNKDVYFKSSSYVIIEDENGKKYSTSSSYVKWDDDECEVRLSSRLTRGKRYKYEIVKVRAAGERAYTTLKGTFIAR